MVNNTITHTSRNSSGGGRDDCWTESATETLVGAWSNRYLQLNRGNLRQKDWSDVADVVNANCQPPRTDVQCKNRIDTLKKKYKLEKSKSGSSLIPPKWRFFRQIDELIGTANGVSRKKVSTPKSESITVTVKSISTPNPNPNPKLEAVMENLDFTDGTKAYKELARAIVRFGEVYERMEDLKQEEVMKLEKERMEFTRELEFQRLNMLMETQLEIEKMKNKKKNKKKKRLSATDSLSAGKKSEL